MEDPKKKKREALEAFFSFLIIAAAVFFLVYDARESIPHWYVVLGIGIALGLFSIWLAFWVFAFAIRFFVFMVYREVKRCERKFAQNPELLFSEREILLSFLVLVVREIVALTF